VLSPGIVYTASEWIRKAVSSMVLVSISIHLLLDWFHTQLEFCC